MKNIVAFAIVALFAFEALADGGSYFSGPGRSPSYGPKAIAAGFGPGATSSGSQQSASAGSGGTPSSPNNCGCQDSGHH